MRLNGWIGSAATADAKMMGHRFHSADYRVQEATYEDGTVTHANFGFVSHTGEDGVLPPRGFSVRYPQTGGILRMDLNHLFFVQDIEAIYSARHGAVKMKQTAVGRQEQGIFLIRFFTRLPIGQGHEFPLPGVCRKPLRVKNGCSRVVF